MAIYDMPTHKRVKHARNKTNVVNNYIGPEGEIVIDSDRWELRLHDGSKKGGHRFLSSTALATYFVGVNSEAGKLKFSGGQFGFLARVTDQLYKTRTLEVADGLTIVNPKGIAGNPLLGLPARLAEIATAPIATGGTYADVDLLLSTGFYALEANALNIPTSIQTLNASTLIVVKKSATEVTQLLVNIVAGLNVWARSMVAGVWQPWSYLKPSEGTDEILQEGNDAIQRTWSAKMLNELITDRLKDLGTDADDDGDVINYGGSQKKFKESYTGPGISPKTFGPFGTVKDKERWVLYMSGLPTVERQGGSSGTDRLYGGGIIVEAELDGQWKTIYTQDGFNASPGERNPTESNYTLRLVYDGGVGTEKILVVNADQVTIGTYEGEWSGKFKFSTQTRTRKISMTAYRFRKQT